MIAHIDADAFFASVLSRKYPHLRGKPLLALGMGGGCVISASYEAKAKGVKTGMALRDALKLIPDVLRMPSDFNETGLASEQIEAILHQECPIIEQMSIDEWYLDLTAIVGGAPKDPETWARKIREDILRRTSLSVSVGVGPTKLLAKMAGEYRKPGGVTIVARYSTTHRCSIKKPNEQPATSQRATSHGPMNIESFLKDRPAAAIPGIGHRRQIHCEREGWTTAWAIAAAPTERLLQLFGKQGRELQLELLGKRLFDVSTDIAPPQSVSRCRSFRATTDKEILWAHTLRHLEYTVLKMRRWKLGCMGVSLWMRNNDYFYESAHVSLPQPLDTEEDLQPSIRRCFQRVHNPNIPCTQIGIALWRLCPKKSIQFSLFEQPKRSLEGQDLQESLDRLHERYGRNAITRGSAMKVRSGTKITFDMPVYE